MAPLAAIRTRDELLRRAADWTLDDGKLAEIADVSPRIARIAVDRAATYQAPLPEDAGVDKVKTTDPVEGESTDCRDTEPDSNGKSIDADIRYSHIETWGDGPREGTQTD